MKKLLLSAIIAGAVMGCSKNEGIEENFVPGDGAKVAISFASPVNVPTLRSFGNGTTEAWEKTVNKATLFVSNASGKIILRKDIASADLAASATTPIPVVVPGVTVGETCSFAMVLNNTVGTMADQTALMTALENNAAVYNGTFGEVSTAAKRADGFVMTGNAAAKIVEGTTAVVITVKRTVAKVEVETKTTASFTAAYGAATVKINSIDLSKASSDSYLFDRTAEASNKYSAGAKSFTFNQVANEVAGTPKTYQNLFYIYENDDLTTGNRVTLKLNATFDNDGNTATTDDQTPLTYTVELNGEGTGKILRNGAYKVVASINGLTGNDITVQVNVADWETLKTQEVSLGN